MSNAAFSNTSMLAVAGAALLATPFLSALAAAESGAASSARGAPEPMAAVTPGTAVLERIAFGSCNRQDKPQPLWAAIVADEPDLWVWLGDNIYADTADTSLMRARYETQLQRPEYQELLRTCPVIGTWDDHDFGKNNGGVECESKRGSQELLLDFLDEPAGSQRRRQEGVYTSYSYGPPGRRIQVILLDTRYHRELPGPDADVLGELQWAWLEETLTASTASVHLVASSIQVLPEEHPHEKWANFPNARERLFRMIGRSRAPGVFFLSGDRHMAEISRIEHPAVRYPLYEITSSGMTHSYWSLEREPNRHRLGDFHKLLNYGILDFRWRRDAVAVELQIRDRNGDLSLRQVVAFPLQPTSAGKAEGR